MLSKIIDPRISCRWLLRPCTGCKLCSAEAYTKIECTVRHLQRQDKPLAARWGRWRRRDRWCVTETMVEVSYSERRERCGRALYPRKMRDIIVVGDPLISDGRSGSHPANTVFEPNTLLKLKEPKGTQKGAKGLSLRSTLEGCQLEPYWLGFHLRHPF